MTDRKEWTPRHDGDAPPDWDGEVLEIWGPAGKKWVPCVDPIWCHDRLYRYTPKPAAMPSDAAPSERAKDVARKLALKEPNCIVNATAWLSLAARMIERYEPHLLRDPLEDVVKSAMQATTAAQVAVGSYDVGYSAITTELRKRGVKMEGEG